MLEIATEEQINSKTEEDLIFEKWLKSIKIPPVPNVGIDSRYLRVAEQLEKLKHIAKNLKI